MRRYTALLVLIAIGAVLLVATGPAFADPREAARDHAEFRRLWNSKNYVDKMKGLNKLPMGYEPAVKDIIDCLNSDEWMFRGQALIRVFQEKDSNILKLYESQLFDKERRPAVQEHLLWALYNNREFANAERWKRLADLVANVKKFDVKVRARAVRELGVFRGEQPQAKTNFEALLNLLVQYQAEKKPDALMLFHLGDSLESLSGQEYGDEVKSWQLWWTNNKDNDLRPRQQDKMTKDLQEIQLEEHSFARKRGREIENLDVLVLPEFGYSGRYWQPYIAELNKIFACYMVKLPDASRVKPEPKRMGDGYVYPLPQLVEAFEKRREMTQQKKVGIIAHGVSGWIALQYARQRPDSVAFIIVIATWSGQQAFNKQTQQLQNNQNPIIKFYGQSLVYDSSGRSGVLALNEEQQIFAQIGSFKRMHMDPYSLDTFFYNQEEFKELPGGGRCFVPDFEFKKGVLPLDVPALIMWGAKDWCHSKEDQKIIPDAFKNPTLAIYENSFRTLWAEEPVRFFGDVRKMIQKYGIGKEDNKKK